MWANSLSDIPNIFAQVRSTSKIWDQWVVRELFLRFEHLRTLSSKKFIPWYLCPIRMHKTPLESNKIKSTHTLWISNPWIIIDFDVDQVRKHVFRDQSKNSWNSLFLLHFSSPRIIFRRNQKIRRLFSYDTPFS